MTIAKPRAREALGRGWSEAEFVCDSGGWECHNDAGVHEPAGNQRVWIVV
jgi:hypothetical protein